MDYPFLLALAVMFSIAVIGNILIHLYYRQQHKSLLSELEGKDYYISKNANIDSEFTTKLSMKYLSCLGDVVFTDHNIFVLQKRKFIKQYAPALAFSNNQFNTSFRNIGKSYMISECYLKNNYLVIKSAKQDIVDIDSTIQIKLNDETNIVEILAKYHLNPKP